MAGRDEEFVAKLRSLSFPRKAGQSEKRPVVNEIDGSDGGHHVIHWDGRQDAFVRPSPVGARARPQEG